MQDILGVILCGGESKRMGRDKGLISIKDTIQAKFMADKLAFLQVHVVFSINENQFNNYCLHVLPDDLIVDDHELKGPARGLLTVHKRCPDKDLLLLACDMLEMDSGTIQNLIDVYNIEKGYHYYVYQDEKYAQPFCGIYTAEGINRLDVNIFSQPLKNISMQYILNSGVTRRMAINNKKVFTNYNAAPASER